MTVTGMTDDGRFIVSSWGQQFYVNPSTYQKNDNVATFEVVKYE